MKGSSSPAFIVKTHNNHNNNSNTLKQFYKLLSAQILLLSVNSPFLLKKKHLFKLLLACPTVRFRPLLRSQAISYKNVQNFKNENGISVFKK